jgi:hypothetical protein
MITKAYAQTPNSNSVNLLQPLGSQTTITPGRNGIQDYVGQMFPIFLGVTVALAIFMITWGGMQYIFSRVPGIKGTGRQRIESAFWGLLIALAAWILLQTINPQLNILGSTFQ